MPAILGPPRCYHLVVSDPTEGALIDVVVFEVDGRRLGLRAERVVEVLPMAELRDALEGGPFVEGMLDVRGELLPVISLRATLDRPSRELGVDEHMLRVRVDEPSDVLLRVDRAIDLVGVDPARLEAAIGGTPPGWITRDGVLLMDDPAHLLGPRGLEALARQRGGSPAG